MELRKIVKEDKNEILLIYEEYIESEPIDGIDTFEGIRNLEHLNKMRFEEWYQELIDNEDKEKIPAYYSTQITYAVIEDDKIIGFLNARWENVPVLEKYGGLIGYSIRPKYRGFGYANEMLSLGLEKYKEKNYSKINISCKDFNIPSKKVIEKNNGILEREYYNKEDGYNYLIYNINL